MPAPHAGGHVGAERRQPPREGGAVLLRGDDDHRLAADEPLLAVPCDDVDEEGGVAIHLDDVLTGGRGLDGAVPASRRDLRHQLTPV